MAPTVGVDDRRRHPRVRFESLVRVGGAGGKRHKALGRDISFGGCSFYVEESAELSTYERIEGALTPPRHFVDTVFESRCRLRGRIAGERRGADDRRCVAVEFDNDLRKSHNL